jgi:ferredoxin-like protein FixX
VIVAGDVPEGIDARSVVLIGTVGGEGFDAFRRGRRDEPDPMDRWARRVIDPIAAGLGAKPAYPNDKPYPPFQRWAMRAEDVYPSPLGLLIHPEHGLWHAYRGALLFSGRVDGLPVRSGRRSPCETCEAKPCLAACPVGAFTGTSYDVAACAGHLRADAEPRCLSLGCRARAACPVGVASRYGDEQVRFHMRAFARARRIPVREE